MKIRKNKFGIRNSEFESGNINSEFEIRNWKMENGNQELRFSEEKAPAAMGDVLSGEF